MTSLFIYLCFGLIIHRWWYSEWPWSSLKEGDLWTVRMAAVSAAILMVNGIAFSVYPNGTPPDAVALFLLIGAFLLPVAIITFPTSVIWMFLKNRKRIREREEEIYSNLNEEEKREIEITNNAYSRGLLNGYMFRR